VIRVLIVEDNKSRAKLAKAIIENEGLATENIFVVDNVKEAVHELHTKKFSLMLLDMNLPIRARGKKKNNSGVTILKELESNIENVPTVIIGITSHTDLHKQYGDYFISRDFHLFNNSESDIWETALSNKIRWLVKEQNSKDKEIKKKVVVTVHGIVTAGKWQSSLENKVYGNNESIILVPFEFHNISPSRLLNPWSRKQVASNFEGQLLELFKKYPESEFYFFAHSFGTFLLAEALKKLKTENVPRIKFVVLAGSVLKRTFGWHEIRSRLSIKSIVNDCAVDDIPLLVSEVFAYGLGMAGRVGFDSFRSDELINRKFSGGHSFFEKSESFYENFWLPIIHEERIAKPVSPITNSTVESLVDSIKSIFWSVALLLTLYLLVF